MGDPPGAGQEHRPGHGRYARAVERAITGYHQDVEGDWVAEISCGHDQHVRHLPPFQLRGWVLEEKGRAEKVGTAIDCPLCDRAELPEGLRLVRSSAEWSEHTMPSGLRRAHRLARGTWARVAVHEGRLRFVAATGPALRVELVPGSTQAIPPDVEHEVQPLGQVRFTIDFFAVDEGRMAGEVAAAEPVPPLAQLGADQAGDPACWAGLLCPGCGVVLGDGPHDRDCRAGPRM